MNQGVTLRIPPFKPILGVWRGGILTKFSSSFWRGGILRNFFSKRHFFLTINNLFLMFWYRHHPKKAGTRKSTKLASISFDCMQKLHNLDWCVQIFEKEEENTKILKPKWKEVQTIGRIYKTQRGVCLGSGVSLQILKKSWVWRVGYLKRKNIFVLLKGGILKEAGILSVTPW